MLGMQSEDKPNMQYVLLFVAHLSDFIKQRDVLDLALIMRVDSRLVVIYH